MLLGAARARGAFPQQLASAQIHQTGAGRDHSRAGYQQIAGAIVLDVEIERGIGTIDLMELLGGQGMNIRRLGHTILTEGFVSDSYRQYIVTRLRKGESDLGLQAGAGFDIR
ncbi:hypothetical protein D3C85_1400520 [compost metagenome]